MKTIFRTIAFLLPQALMAAATGADAPGLVINIAGNAEVRGDKVLLGEIAIGGAALPHEWRERAVAQAPDPGKSREYPIAIIAYALQQYPDMNNVVLRGTVNTRVRRAEMSLDPETVKEAVHAFVSMHERWGEEQNKRIFYDYIPTVSRLPAGQAQAVVRGFQEKPAKTDEFEFHVEILVNGVVERTLAIGAAVIPEREVWVASKTLPKGHTLSDGDLTARILPSRKTGSYIPSSEPVAGLELAYAMKQGQPIFRHATREPICAARGDQVTVSAAAGGLNIRMQARALADGRRGDVIMCENNNSKRRILVRLVGSKQASTDIGGTEGIQQ